MCKEDVRIGRQKNFRTTLAPTNVNPGPVEIAPQNVMRTRLIVTLIVQTAIANQTEFIIRASTSDGPVVGALTLQSPVLYLDVERDGQIVTDRLFASSQVVVDCSIAATEVYFVQALADL